MHTKTDQQGSAAVNTLQDLKNAYYQELNITNDKSRVRPLVEARVAFVNAFRHYFTKTDLGRAFGKTHATVIHYINLHDTLMRERRYAQNYKTACFIRGMYLNNETPNQLEEEVKFLREENANLKKELHLLRNKLDQCISTYQFTPSLDSSLV